MEATSWTTEQAQRDMRVAYFSGAPGVFASAAVWLVAGAVALQATAAHGPARVLMNVAGIGSAKRIVQKDGSAAPLEDLRFTAAKEYERS